MVSHLASVFAESALLQALWGFLVVNGVKGLALFVLAWTALKLFPGLSSELRHLFWLLVIVSSLVFPVAWLIAPSVLLSVPVSVGRSMSPLFAAVPFAARSEFLEIMIVPGADSIVADHAATVLRPLLPLLAGGVWVAGALFFLQRLAVGRFAARRLLRVARPAAIEPGLLRELSRRLKMTKAIQVMQCRECAIPFTYGTLRPAATGGSTKTTWSF